MNLGWYILIFGLTLLLLGEIKQFSNYFNQIFRAPPQLEKPKNMDELYLRLYKHVAIIAIILIIITSIVLTAMVFKVFPTTLEANKVVGTFAGIFGVLWACIGIYKMLSPKSEKGT